MWNGNTNVSSWSLKQGWCLFAYKAQFKTPWNKPLTLLSPILIWSLLRKGKHCIRREGFHFYLRNIKKASVLLLLMAAMASSTAPLLLLLCSQGHREDPTVSSLDSTVLPDPALFSAAYGHLCSTFWLHSLPKVVDQKDGSFPPCWGNLPGPYF